MFFRRRTFVAAGPLAFLSDAIARVGGRAISQASCRAHPSSRYRPIPSRAHHCSLLSGAKTQRPQTFEARGTGEVVVFKGLGCEHAPLHHSPTHLVFQFPSQSRRFVISCHIYADFSCQSQGTRVFAAGEPSCCAHVNAASLPNPAHHFSSHFSTFSRSFLPESIYQSILTNLILARHQSGCLPQRFSSMFKVHHALLLIRLSTASFRLFLLNSLLLSTHSTSSPRALCFFEAP